MASPPPTSGPHLRYIRGRLSGLPVRAVLALLVAQAAAFLLFVLAGRPDWVIEHLALLPRQALGPEPWQLLTSNFVHVGPGGGLASLIFGGLTLWIFGGAIEDAAGRWGLLRVWFVSHLAGAVVAAAVGRLLSVSLVTSGTSFASLGLVAGFGAVFTTVPLSFFGVAQMRGRTVALVLVGLMLVQSLFYRDLIGVAAGLAAAGAGWAAVRGVGFDWRALATARDRARLWWLRRKYKVIDGGQPRRRYLN